MAPSRSSRSGDRHERPTLRRLEAVLLVVEHPLAASDLNRVAAARWLARNGRGPRHRVAEAGLEGAEVLGRVDERVAAEVVLDAGLLDQAVEQIAGLVVVDGDEAGEVDV